MKIAARMHTHTNTRTRAHTLTHNTYKHARVHALAYTHTSTYARADVLLNYRVYGIKKLNSLCQCYFTYCSHGDEQTKTHAQSEQRDV